MKTPRFFRPNILSTAALVGFLMNPVNLSAQERDNRHPEPPPPPERQTDKHAPDRAGQPPAAKIQHLRQAAELLQAAGFEKMAAQTQAEIGRLEAESRRPEGQASRNDNRPDAVAALKNELNQLRRELEELRNQVRDLKADRTPKHSPQPPHTPQAQPPQDAPPPQMPPGGRPVRPMRPNPHDQDAPNPGNEQPQ
ncbi:MAG: hypothetical protein NTV46_20955 [Verrucomicrobia bacterium]|nr:hypothetical protein [Verrucomicrobiota bacterium]